MYSLTLKKVIKNNNTTAFPKVLRQAIWAVTKSIKINVSTPLQSGPLFKPSYTKLLHPHSKISQHTGRLGFNIFIPDFDFENLP